MAKITKVRVMESNSSDRLEKLVNAFIEGLGDDGEVVNISIAYGDQSGMRALIMYHEG